MKDKKKELCPMSSGISPKSCYSGMYFKCIMCGKDMSTPPPSYEEEWVKAFDRGFRFEENNNNGGPILLFQIWEDGSRSLARKEYLLAFITQTLLTDRSRLIQEIEKMKKREGFKCYDKGDEEEYIENKGFNSALQSVLNLLK